ncbi:MAG: alpha/beta fold hydrolase [Myxococcota bacterium]
MRRPQLADIALPKFRARGPWWGPDLQTLRNSFVAPRLDATRYPEKRLTLPLADGSGDALVGLLQTPATATGRPLAVLVHGLSGSEDSAYMIASARALLEEGYPVLRLNLRGAGPARPLCRYQYHAGRSEDLRDALGSDAFADPIRNGSGALVLVGYSLGANMLLKFLAEFGARFPIVGACAISAPIDLEAASYRFLHPRNAVYHWNLLRSMRRETLDDGGEVSDAEREAVTDAKSILEFDDRFVAPRNGYPDAAAYYADNMARRFLAEISVPTLVIYARDDPWIPADTYTSYRWSDNPNLLPLLPKRGGHVGFHGHGSAIPWHDRCLLPFFDALGSHPG